MAGQPKERYPTWREAWDYLFPDRERNTIPCPTYFLDRETAKAVCHQYFSCETCKDQPILPEVAERLGIKPIEVNEDV